jgi:uncharacterized Zn finger protein (UPF0148 family)
MTELDEIDEMAGTTKGDQEMTDGKCPRCGASLHFNDEIGMFCPACAQRRDAFQVAWEETRRNANEQAKQRRASDIALAATEAERVARALRGGQMPPPFAVCEGHAERLLRLEDADQACSEHAEAIDMWRQGVDARLEELEAAQADTSSTLLTVTGRSVERLEAIEQKPDRLGLDGMAEAVMRLLKRVADLEAANEAEDADERESARAWAAFVDPTGYGADEPPTPTLCPAVTRVEVRDHFGRCLFFAAPANDVDLRYSDDGKTMTVVLKR